MGVSYKNFWSLNTDEVVVTGILRDYFKKKAEVFMPLNTQLKDIDLLVTNLRNRKIVSIQVKGSRAYEPKKNERKKYGEGSAGWFFLPKKVISRCTADYFIFLIYVIEEQRNKGRKELKTHTITIKPDELGKICKERKILHKRYSFYIWINPNKEKAFDFRDEKKRGQINLDKYLDEKGLKSILQDVS
jgi:hypothetical protein